MANINDIAKACGTSITTVSLVMNGNDRKISARTRQRVLSAAKLMDYQPSAMARGLSTQRSGAIGISTPMTAHILGLQYYATMITGIVDEAADNGLTVTLFSNFVWKRDDPSRLIFTDGRCDGIVLIGQCGDSIVNAIAKSKLPCVSIHAGRGRFELASIDIDNFGAGYAATEYLIARGHRNIGYFHAGPSPNFSDDRCDGYRQALRDADVVGQDRWVIDGKTDSEDAYGRARALSGRGLDGMTGLVCATDRVALGAMQGFRDADVRVPADISVIGIDGLQDGEHSYPKLTTLDQSLENLGKAAVRELLQYVEDPKALPRHTVWPVELAVRGSVTSLSSTSPLGSRWK